MPNTTNYLINVLLDLSLLSNTWTISGEVYQSTSIFEMYIWSQIYTSSKKVQVKYIWFGCLHDHSKKVTFEVVHTI